MINSWKLMANSCSSTQWTILNINLGEFTLNHILLRKAIIDLKLQYKLKFFTLHFSLFTFKWSLRNLNYFIFGFNSSGESFVNISTF